AARPPPAPGWVPPGGAGGVGSSSGSRGGPAPAWLRLRGARLGSKVRGCAAQRHGPMGRGWHGPCAPAGAHRNGAAMATADRLRGPGGGGDGGRALTLGFVARATLVVILLWALANVVWQGRDLLFIAFFSVLVASFLSIFVDWLEEQGVSRLVGALIVLVALAVLGAGGGVLLWPALREQAVQLQEQLPPALAEITAWF